jgi:hypothetical protein
MSASIEQADAVRDRLSFIADRNEGRITPEMVVEDAKDPDSPLHGYFTWNVKKAAYDHWLYQARALIRSVTIVFRDEKTVVRVPAYLRDPEMESEDQGYISIKKLRTQEDRAREAVVAEFVRAAGILRRARDIASALNLAGEIDGLVEQIERVKAKVEEARV